VDSTAAGSYNPQTADVRFRRESNPDLRFRKMSRATLPGQSSAAGALLKYPWARRNADQISLSGELRGVRLRAVLFWAP